jgi:hypothetical protein
VDHERPESEMDGHMDILLHRGKARAHCIAEKIHVAHILSGFAGAKIGVNCTGSTPPAPGRSAYTGNAPGSFGAGKCCFAVL